MLHQLFGKGNLENISQNSQNIIWHLRAPRVLLGVLVGSSLSLAGAGMQAFTKNPLAEPYILGVSAGASCGAVGVMVTGIFGFLGTYQIQLGAFIGAMAAIMLVYFLARTAGEIAPIKFILVGVAISAMFSAFTNFLVYSAPNEAKVREATFWMMGGVAGVKWPALVPLALILPPCLFLMFSLAASLNAMMMGDDTAIALGVNVNLVRKLVIAVTALLVGTSVAIAGSIGFVGLAVPHMVRSLVGPDHRKLLPLCTLGGGSFLIWVDVAARMLDIPKEIPLGILTSLIGAPIFLWMIKNRRYAAGQ